MIEIVANVMAGFAAHRWLEEPTRDWFPGDDENRIISYIQGMALIQLMFALVTYRKLDWRTWWLVHGLLAITSITVGVGTVLGYVVDGLQRAGKP